MSGEVLWAPAGPPDALQRLQPYFDAMGRGTLHLGCQPYMASVMKLSGNFFIAATIETIAEGMTLAEKNGISRCTSVKVWAHRRLALIRPSCYQLQTPV